MGVIKPLSDTNALLDRRSHWLQTQGERRQFVCLASVLNLCSPKCFSAVFQKQLIYRSFHFDMFCATGGWQKLSRSHSNIYPETEGTSICCAGWRISSCFSPVDGKKIMFPNTMLCIKPKTKNKIPNQAIINEMFRNNNPVYLTLNQVVFYLFGCLNF